jgi:hypothetical protein
MTDNKKQDLPNFPDFTKTINNKALDKLSIKELEKLNKILDKIDY